MTLDIGFSSLYFPNAGIIGLYPPTQLFAPTGPPDSMLLNCISSLVFNKVPMLLCCLCAPSLQVLVRDLELGNTRSWHWPLGTLELQGYATMSSSWGAGDPNHGSSWMLGKYSIYWATSPVQPWALYSPASTSQVWHDWCAPANPALFLYFYFPFSFLFTDLILFPHIFLSHLSNLCFIMIDLDYCHGLYDSLLYPSWPWKLPLILLYCGSWNRQIAYPTRTPV